MWFIDPFTQQIFSESLRRARNYSMWSEYIREQTPDALLYGTVTFTFKQCTEIRIHVHSFWESKYIKWMRDSPHHHPKYLEHSISENRLLQLESPLGKSCLMCTFLRDKTLVFQFPCAGSAWAGLTRPLAYLQWCSCSLAGSGAISTWVT